MGFRTGSIGTDAELEETGGSQIEDRQGIDRGNFGNRPVFELCFIKRPVSAALETVTHDRFRNRRGQILCDVGQAKSPARAGKAAVAKAHAEWRRHVVTWQNAQPGIRPKRQREIGNCFGIELHSVSRNHARPQQGPRPDGQFS
ncbi:hypothetical protein D3C72_1890680 [compost metagenome]